MKKLVIGVYSLSLVATGLGMTSCSNGGVFGGAYMAYYNFSLGQIAADRERTKMTFDADKDGKLSQAEENAYEINKYHRRWRVGQGISPEAELTPAQQRKWDAELIEFRKLLQ